MTISFRSIDANNASVLKSVEAGVFDNDVQPGLLQAFLANPSNLLEVAVAEGKVVGMATAISYVHPDKPLALFINEVGVATAYRQMGLGRQLVSRLIERGRALGCREAWVATELSNRAARALYEALGGIEDPERAVIYEYRLEN